MEIFFLVNAVTSGTLSTVCDNNSNSNFLIQVTKYNSYTHRQRMTQTLTMVGSLSSLEVSNIPILAERVSKLRSYIPVVALSSYTSQS